MLKQMVTFSLCSLFIAGAIYIGLFKNRVWAEGVLDHQGADLMTTEPKDFPIATFGGGCFWCLESEFRAQNGVLYTKVGYMGGDVNSPSYQDVSTGQTGHAEVIQVTYNPTKTSYKELVEFFLLKAHDPTQVNRQGVDVGTQYRSEIFTHDEEQDKIARATIADIDSRHVYKDKIATKIAPATAFWMGEDYHQQYYEKYEKQHGQPHIRVLLKHQK